MRAAQIIEHIPVVIYWKEEGKFKKRYGRIEFFREVYRILKPKGIFVLSVPIEWPYWAQDPTHVDVPFLNESISYYCGEWGGNTPGDFAMESYHINFAFKRVESHKVESNLIATLEKP